MDTTFEAAAEYVRTYYSETEGEGLIKVYDLGLENFFGRPERRLRAIVLVQGPGNGSMDKVRRDDWTVWPVNCKRAGRVLYGEHSNGRK